MISPEARHPSHRSHPIPVGPTRIVGREREVEQLCRLLLNSDARLLTLTGPGGVGKTRLALEVAHQVSDHFTDGVRWVNLAPMRDADRVLNAITFALGLEKRQEHTLVTTIVQALRGRRMLLVLDNTEQVPAIGLPVAELVAGCPGLSVLTTGRAPLDVRTEQRFSVDPLSVSAKDVGSTFHEATMSPAVALFAERARAVEPSFRVTAHTITELERICRCLDGLPLAIELVAAQTRVLGLAELLARLEQHLPPIVGGARDLPARQQTIERTIAWSDDLLSPEERRAFFHLAVCAGGFSLEAAAAILADPVRDGNALDAATLVSALVRHSLLRREEGASGQSRFRMLELTRVYALQRLVDSGEAECAGRRHAHYCLALVQQAEAAFGGPDGHVWLDRLEADHDNLREALSWALENGESALAVQLAVPLARFWYVRGHLAEGRTWLERVLAAAEDAEPTDRAALVGALGVLAGAQGDANAEAHRAEEALQLARTSGDEQVMATALHRRGNVARGHGALTEAGCYYEDALVLFRRVGDRTGEAAALNNLGIVAAGQGDMQRARRLLEEASKGYRQLENQRGMAIALCNLGQRAAETDGAAAALGAYQEALPLFQAIGDTAGIAWCVQALAGLAAEEGTATQAARFYGAAEAMRDRIDWRFSEQEQREYDREIAALREQMSAKALRDAWAGGRLLTTEQAIAEIAALLEAGTLGVPSRTGCPARLSEREVDVLRLVADGLTNAEIAYRLTLSPHTVDAHLRRIYRKLEVRSRSAASRIAVEHDLV